jgi:hypothetical protein
MLLAWMLIKTECPKKYVHARPYSHELGKKSIVSL